MVSRYCRTNSFMRHFSSLHCGGLSRQSLRRMHRILGLEATDLSETGSDTVSADFMVERTSGRVGGRGVPNQPKGSSASIPTRALRPQGDICLVGDGARWDFRA